jgi:acetolactate synthase-1/2/3 large subunit
MIKLSDYVVKFLKQAGLSHIFMLTGGGCMHLVDSVGRSEIEYVCCLHEQACAFAAQSYSEYKNDLGAALVTTGPGGTNAVTGVAAAWLDSSSTIFISGQVKRADLLHSRKVRSMGPQEVDIISIVSPITKYAVTVLEPKDIRYHLEKALHLARSGRRGPVWIDLPLDVQAAMIDEDLLRGYSSETPASRGDELRQAVAETLKLLEHAERPVLYLGNGARNARQSGSVEALIEALKIPVLISWKAIDFIPEDNRFYAGRPGAIGQRGANFTQQNSDLVIVVGARLDLPSVAFSHQNFARAARKVIVDIDPAEISKFEMPIDVPVVATAEAFIDEMLRQLPSAKTGKWVEWNGRAQDWKARYPVVISEYRQDRKGTVNLYTLIDALSDAAGENDLLTPGSSGPCSEVFLQAWRVKKGQRIVNAPSLGAMGTGLPGSIGACVASGLRRTICVNGDGGFQLNIQDLETVRRLNLPIKYFILCNGTYASIMTTQQNYFQGRMVGSDPSSRLTLPDIRKVAEAYGIMTSEIADHAGIHEGVRAVLDSPGPAVCAVHVSSDQVAAPRTTSSVRPDGTIVSLPMEDLAPRLPREEFLANMIVTPLPE